MVAAKQALYQILRGKTLWVILRGTVFNVGSLECVEAKCCTRTAPEPTGGEHWLAGKEALKRAVEAAEPRLDRSTGQVPAQAAKGGRLTSVSGSSSLGGRHQQHSCLRYYIFGGCKRGPALRRRPGCAPLCFY
ncbi:hypothetical protein GJAV_G00021850 [Gymnothorax javanicus]|nr:hypothetical protein GJAV_G00021850 [Gymnothorax javanicus]